jgi:amphi-Trp domain-containing protein
MEKDKIEFKALMDPAAAADYLTALAKGFKAGRIVVEKDGERLELCPEPGTRAEVEVAARIKKDKAKFALELSWRLPLEEAESPAALRISAGTDAAAQPAPQKPALRKAEDKKPETKKPAPPAARAASAPAPAAAPKSDVKPGAPAENEPGGKAPVAAASQPRPTK